MVLLRFKAWIVFFWFFLAAIFECCSHFFSNRVPGLDFYLCGIFRKKLTKKKTNETRKKEMPTRFSEQSDRCVPGAIICLFFFINFFVYKIFIWTDNRKKRTDDLFFFDVVADDFFCWKMGATRKIPKSRKNEKTILIFWPKNGKRSRINRMKTENTEKWKEKWRTIQSN